MYMLDGKPLPLDRAFTHNSIQYPANWLRLSTQEQRDALGITEVAPEPWYDQRFYWGPNNPKDHTQLVEQWVGQTKQTAASLLNQYDWYIVRQSETGKAVPQEVLTYRASVRTQSDNREAMINGTSDTDQLYAVITQDFGGLFPWPRGPFESAPVADEPVPEDPIVVDGVTSGTVITGDTIFGGTGEDTLTF